MNKILKRIPQNGKYFLYYSNRMQIGYGNKNASDKNAHEGTYQLFYSHIDTLMDKMRYSIKGEGKDRKDLKAILEKYDKKYLKDLVNDLMQWKKEEKEEEEKNRY
jgi:hypothetical protein